MYLFAPETCHAFCHVAVEEIKMLLEQDNSKAELEDHVFIPYSG